MTIEEAIAYWEQFLSEIDMMEENCLWPSADYAETQRKATKMAISALRAQQELESNSKVVKSNVPLTLDELREMDGEPVWVQSPGIPEYGRWAIVEGVAANSLLLLNDFTCHDYGETWLAYRRKPEEGTV